MVEGDSAAIMATISTQLRKFKEPTREELTRHFFALPPREIFADEQQQQQQQGSSKNKSPPPSSGGSGSDNGNAEEKGEMEINAVLSLGQEGVEDSYVRVLVR